MRYLPHVALFALLMALTVAVFGSQPESPGNVSPRASAEPSSTGAGDVLSGTPAPQVTTRVGPPAGFAISGPPTADGPQSKLWWNDGAWWGLVADATTGATRIYELEAAPQTWVDTGVSVDERGYALGDAMWDGANLYVVSAGSRPTATRSARLMRYTYDPQARTYSMDPGFPVQLTDAGVERINMAKDSTGRLWVTYIANRQVMVNHSLDADHTWGVPMVLPGSGAVGDDVAAIVAYGGSIGVLWTNQVAWGLHFASHRDADPVDVWTGVTTIDEGPGRVDDHVSISALDGPHGPSLFAAVKTAREEQADAIRTDPQILLYQMTPDGAWSRYVFGTVSDRHSRPLVVIDEGAREVYVFAVSPSGGGSIYFKSTPADEVVLQPGIGSPLLHMPDHTDISDPTSTKQNVTSESGLLVLASDETAATYLHAHLPLTDPARQ